MSELQIFYSSIFFILGTALGSFLNVLIDRIPRGKSVLFGRSKCENCKKPLSFADLIPIASYIFLGGKCRYCQSSIPKRILLVEVLSGLAFCGAYLYLLWQSVSIPTLLFLLIVVSLLLSIFFTDLEYGVIPDELLVALGVVILLFTATFNKTALLQNLIIGVISFLFFFLLFFLTHGRGMGFGDVKLAGALGFFLGFPKILPALYLAFLIGAVVSLILVGLGKKRLRGDTVPFGPFLVVGTLIAYVWGGAMLEIFNRLFLS